MTLVKQQELCKLFVDVGQKQYDIAAIGSVIAKTSQKGWNDFITTLLQGKGDPTVEKACEELEIAVAKYNKLNHAEIPLKIVWNYFAAKIIRSVFVAPAELVNNWYFICHSAEIPNPGEFITVQIFQEPLVAVRQVDRTIRIFLNVCTHRQSPVFEGRGCLVADKPALCPYHGWAFGIDGRCKNAPGANRGEFGADFDLQNYSLQEMEVKIDENQAVFAKLVGNSASAGSQFEHKQDIISSHNLQQQTGRNIGVAIANLLQSVTPGYTEGETASLPEEIRLCLKIGYLESQLRQIADITQEQGIVLSSSVAMEDRQLLLESLIGELKQAILTVDNDSSTPEFNEILSRFCYGDNQQLISCPYKQLRYPALAPVPSPMLGRGVPSWRGEGSDNKSLTGHDITLKESTQELVDSPSVESSLELGASNERREALPIWIYGDAELFALEVEHLIKPTWQFVCHVNEVPDPGNFTWLDIVGDRAYVIRTTDGELFAGRLKDVRERGNCLHFGVPNYGLEPIDIDVFYGFIFIRFTWSGPRVADTWYQPDLLEPYRLQNMQPIGGPGRYDINVEVDYKLLWENFLEDYHFPIMHKGLTRRFGVSSDCEGINGMIIPIRDPASPSLSPIEQKYHDNLKAVGRHSWEYEKHLHDLAAKNQSLPEPLCYSVFCSMSAQEQIPMPFSLSVFPEHVQTFSLVPAGPRECRFHVRSYGQPLDPNTWMGIAIQEARLANIQLLAESLQEDIRVNYISQDSVSSRLFEKIGIFSIAEFDVAKFQEAISAKLPITRRQKKLL